MAQASPIAPIIHSNRQFLPFHCHHVTTKHAIVPAHTFTSHSCTFTHTHTHTHTRTHACMHVHTHACTHTLTHTHTHTHTHTTIHTVQTDRGEGQCCLTEISGEEKCLEADFAFEGVSNLVFYTQSTITVISGRSFEGRESSRDKGVGHHVIMIMVGLFVIMIMVGLSVIMIMVVI